MTDRNRFDRIDRVEGVSGTYKDLRVNIVAGPGVAGSATKQALLSISANLLSRFCKRVNVCVENSRCLLVNFRSQSIHEVLTDQAKKTRNCTFSLNAGDRDFNSTLVIGRGQSRDAPNAVWIDSSGWLAGCGRGATSGEVDYIPDDTNLIGASWAACLGVAEIFRFANGDVNLGGFSKWFSLFDFQKAASPEGLQNPVDFPKEAEFGTIHQVGCGAVGSSFIFLLALLDWRAKLHIIDYDHIEDQNCPTSLIFSDEDARLERKKVEVCDQYLKTGSIKAFPFEGDFRQFVVSGLYNLNVPDLVLCFANERNIWLQIEQELPPLAYHATTSKSWSVNFGRHIPLKEWCLVCRFGAEINHTMKTGCAMGEIGHDINTQTEILGMLPFLPVAAATLVLADLAKLALADFPFNDNFIQFSFRASDGSFLGYNRPPNPCIVCKDFDQGVYPDAIKKTKFWCLSR